MHNAPSVSYPVGRSRLAGVLLAVAWAAAAAGIAAWWAQAQPSVLRATCAALALVGCGAIALRGWSASAHGSLAWNGEGWTWKGPDSQEAGEPQCVLDLQHTMLLQWRSPARTRWFWVERRIASTRWDDLRRAVYSRARSGAARSEPGREARP